MPLIETDDQSTPAFGMGRLAPHANQKKFRSMWACVEGENDGRWPSLREAQEGIPVGNDGRVKLPFTEFTRGKGQTHDINYGKVKLREMIVPIEDAEAKDRYEGNLSTEAVKQFAARQEAKVDTLRSQGLHASTSLTQDAPQLFDNPNPQTQT